MFSSLCRRIYHHKSCDIRGSALSNLKNRARDLITNFSRERKKKNREFFLNPIQKKTNFKIQRKKNFFFLSSPLLSFSITKNFKKFSINLNKSNNINKHSYPFLKYIKRRY